MKNKINKFIDVPPRFDDLSFNKQRFLKHWKKIQKYLVILLIILLFISVYYYFFIKSNKLYDYHHYESYANTLLIKRTFQEGNFNELAFYIKYSLAHKLIYFQSLPFMFLFGESQFIHTYSRFLFNITLYIFLFYSLTKLMKAKKALILTLFLFSSYFSIESLASPYVDLTFFLSNSLLFIYTNLFIKNYKKHGFGLFISLILVFFSKSSALSFIPIYSFFILIYIFIKRKNVFFSSTKFICLIILSFIILFGIGYLFSPKSLSFDISRITARTIEGQKGMNLLNTIINSFVIMANKGIKINLFFLNKFRFMWYSIIAYLSQFYFIKKKKWFWLYLFMISELYLIFLFNILGVGGEFRYALQFYFIYLFAFFEIIFDSLSKLKVSFSFMVILCLVLMSINLASLNNTYFNPSFSVNTKLTEEINSQILNQLPENSTIFMCDYYAGLCEKQGLSRFYYGFSEISDGNNFNQNLSLKDADSRFRVRIHANLNESDYVVCTEDCQNISLNKFKLIQNTSIRYQTVYVFKRILH